MLAEHLVDELHVDIDACVCEPGEWVGGLEVVVEELSHVAVVCAEPLADGDGEALLWAIDDVVREVFAGDLFEEAFWIVGAEKTDIGIEELFKFKDSK